MSSSKQRRYANGGLEKSGLDTETPDLAKTYLLNLPQLLFGGLSENWFLKELGDFHWGMVCHSFGVYSAKLLDKKNRRLFSTFVRITIEGNCSFQEFNENNLLELKGNIAQFRSNRYFSEINGSHEDKQLKCRMMTSFVTRGHDNLSLLPTESSMLKQSKAYQLESQPDYARGYSAIKMHVTSKQDNRVPPQVELAGVSFSPIDHHLFSTNYTISPMHDISGVNLLYFPSYVRIADTCEREYFHTHRDMHQLNGDWALFTSTIARDIYFFGNANIEDKLEFRLNECVFLPDYKVKTTSVMYRKRDMAMIGLIYTVKQLTDLFSDFSFFWKHLNEINPSGQSSKKEARIVVNKEDDVAVIGMSGILPGAEGIQIYWDKEVSGQSPIIEIPQDRWNWRDHFGNPFNEEKKTMCNRGGFIPDIFGFDADFFGMNESEAAQMDPSERLMHQEVWHVFDNAGYPHSLMANTTIGLFLGVGSISPGNDNTLLGSKLARSFGLTGPTLTIDAGTASSLVALEKAVRALRFEECDISIVGGIRLCLSPLEYLAADRAGRLSWEGLPRLCDRGSRGLVPGEAVAVVLLKPLRKAIQDGDHVDGIIRGSTLNCGGFSPSLLATNAEMHSKLIQNAWQNCNLDPNTATYMELHGSCLPNEDKAEVDALKQATEAMCTKQSPVHKSCGLGSIKTHLGELGAASGIVALIHTLMAMNRKWLPGVFNHQGLHPEILLDQSHFYLPNEGRYWETLEDRNGNPIPRRAGISSLGHGDINAHAIVEEYRHYTPPALHEPPYLFLLSAKGQTQLSNYVERFTRFFFVSMVRGRKLNLNDICFTLQTGREPMPHRLAVLFNDIKELHNALKNYSSESSNLYQGQLDQGRAIPQDQQTINKFLIDRDLAGLADYWVRGAEIDWKRLYGLPKPRRTSLPPYPFRLRRYPIADKDSNTQEHPFVKEMIPSLSLGQGIAFKLSADVINPLFSEHRLAGKVVLPWSDLLEMVYATFIKLDRGKKFCIQDVVWNKPLTRQAATNDLYISLIEQNRQLNFSIKSESRPQEAIVEGSLSTDFDPKPHQECIDIKCLMARMDTEIPGWECYELLQRCGLDYGTHYHCIDQIRHDFDEVVTQFKVPLQMRTAWKRYHLHPIIMDGILLSALTPLLKTYSCPTGIYHPSFLKRTALLKPLSFQGYIHLRRLSTNTCSGTIYDLGGHPEVIMEGLEVFYSGKTVS